MPKKSSKLFLGPFLRDFLGDSLFFMGGTSPSAIDFLVAKPLNNANSLGLLVDYPTLQNVFEKIKCRDSFGKAYMVDTEDDCNWRLFRMIPGDDSK
mmetsp:Transcript_24972/g.40886  ORF Transcript_24972/g.40886 Transcript_24972/m.40886 type:complete len:96 (-) Transcript_24972:1704-1991(-)